MKRQNTFGWFQRIATGGKYYSRENLKACPKKRYIKSV